MTGTLAERLQEAMVGTWQINSPYYAFYDDPREAEALSASPVWDHELEVYRFADGSLGRFIQARDDTGALIWELPVGVGMEASQPLPRMQFVAVNEEQWDA